MFIAYRCLISAVIATTFFYQYLNRYLNLLLNKFLFAFALTVETAELVYYAYQIFVVNVFGLSEKKFNHSKKFKR